MKLLLIVVVGFVAILLSIMASGITDVVTDFRTDLLTETFDGDTGVGITTKSIQLSSALWNSSLANADASTNVTNDAPSLSSYNSTSRQLTVGGLAANITRTITVNYKSAGLADYPGGEDVSTNIPAIVLAFIIMLPAAGIIYLIISVIRRR